MRVSHKRGDVIEGVHDVSVAVIDGEALVFSSGDVDRRFYIRSAAKPLQARASQQAGADLNPIQLAVAASSHQGLPVHVAVVEDMLAEMGLSPSHLQCPAVYPWGETARDIVVSAGVHTGGARAGAHTGGASAGALTGERIWHNCSGKHAAMLRACVATGWETSTYLQTDHPLQVSIRNTISGLTGHSGDPVSVDGCGAPLTTVSTVELARAYRKLGNDPAFGGVVEAMHRYPGLTRGVGTIDDNVARWWNAVAKIGAMGCLGVAFVDGIGIAVKCWDGTEAAVGVALMETVERVGLMTAPARTALAEFANPPVMGGGMPVGRMEVMA